jgi:hypothetical protein
MDGPEPNWPKYFLLTHAIELAIKAYIISRDDAGAPAPEFVAYWTNNGQKAALGLDLSAAIDPTATLAVHCGNSFFDASFSLIKVLV